MEDYGLDEARAKLLEEMDRVPEAADIHVRNGDTLKAVKMLVESAIRNTDHARPATELLLAELRKKLTLGVSPTSNPIISSLLGLTGRLDRRTVTKQEADEASPYRSLSWQVIHLGPLARDVQSNPMR